MPPSVAISFNSLTSHRVLGLTLLGSLLHLLVVGVIWLEFGLTTRSSLSLISSGVGAVLLGAIPTMLLVTKRLVTPSLIVAGALTVSAYGTWLIYVAPSWPPARLGPTPFGLYLIGWFIVVAVALLTGGGEYWLRQLGKDNDGP